MPGTLLGLKWPKPSCSAAPGPGEEGAVILGKTLWPVVPGLHVPQQMSGWAHLLVATHQAILIIYPLGNNL